MFFLWLQSARKVVKALSETQRSHLYPLNNNSGGRRELFDLYFDPSCCSSTHCLKQSTTLWLAGLIEWALDLSSSLACLREFACFADATCSKVTGLLFLSLLVIRSSCVQVALLVNDLTRRCCPSLVPYFLLIGSLVLVSQQMFLSFDSQFKWVWTAC